jgi:tripartite-type tricarboxylate transporter receptor subunit TctC
MRRRLECHRGAVFFGKKVTIIARSAPGSSYDATAGLIARFMSTYLPGAPNMIVHNMPDAGSLTATNNLYNLAPKDGSFIGVVQRGILTAKLTNPNGVRFDIEKMGWIGNLAPEVATIVSWKRNAVKTTDDLFKTELWRMPSTCRSRSISPRSWRLRKRSPTFSPRRSPRRSKPASS